MSSFEAHQRDNVEVVSGGVEAFQRGDLDGLLALTREDFEIYLPHNLPNSGTYRGHDGFMTWLRQWLDAWDDFKVELTAAEPAGERHVVAMVHQSARGKGSGIPVHMDIAYLWEVREGMFAAMHLYETREEAIRVADQRERASAL
jgi:uncharacterized protein